jgi:hypothetical protein
VFTDYQKAYAFPPRFFGNEVSVTTREAYQRDSTYWNTIRAEPLSADQQKVIAYRDSIEAAHTTQAYLDSVEAQYNKITLSEILYHGVGFRKEARKSNIYISSLLNLINFEVIGGFRLGPYLSYFRRFDDGRRFYPRAAEPGLAGRH